jgi:hypothetical protein
VTLLLKDDAAGTALRVHGYVANVYGRLGTEPTSCWWVGRAVLYEVEDPRAANAVPGRIVRLPWKSIFAPGRRNDLKAIPSNEVVSPRGVNRVGPFHVRAAEWRII